MFKNYFRALWIEIKNTIFKTWYHSLRFGGLLIIPLIYGFSYIFAFWDPFKNVDKLPVALVTQINEKSEQDVFGKALGEVMSNSHETEIGELKLTIKADHIYRDIFKEKTENGVTSIDKDATNEAIDNFSKNEMKNYNVAFLIPNMTKQIDNFIVQSQGQQSNGLNQVIAFKELIDKLLKDNIQIVNNFKNNYLVAFGIDIGAAMSGTHSLMINAIVEALNTQTYKDHIIPIIKASWTSPNQNIENNYNKFVSSIGNIFNTSASNEFKIVNIHTQMHEHGKYGYGLAPFFISVAMWVGAMTLTFAIHRKIYDKRISSLARYMAKYTLLLSGVTIQAIILLTALYFIGFDKIGIGHWLGMLLFAIFSGAVFGSIVQAIRFSIPSRNISILISIFVLILQMASGGGLFPIETQGKAYQALNHILPMGYTVKTFRELTFETRWDQVGLNLGILASYSTIFLILGIIMNHRLTRRWYQVNNFVYPKKDKKPKKVKVTNKGVKND